ncbi:MAG: hypothetical protein PHW35_09100 [Lentimicrobiaceae bacterium]|jgi:hypothetical protein|nr:hypothetical protein [Lentimicrobiaceae bacterium]MDD4598111.1 hypothetical protein [Lentimicrobiaceae bacterium]MDY0024434.1 hypothetical protein [Lentimicrobium sp.]
MKVNHTNYNNKVYLNTDQCNACGQVLKNLTIRDEFYQRNFLRIEVDPELKLSMLFNVVAICHQTRSLVHAGLKLYGWDYLEMGFLQLAKNNSWLLHPQQMDGATVDDISTELSLAFSPDNNGINSTLDQLDERAGLLKGLAHFVTRHYNGSFSSLISATGNMSGGDNGIYNILSQVEAFADPRKKKTSFLVKLMYDAGIFTINDPEHYVPIMDYHMQRVLLRMGCVEVSDPELYELLIRRQLQDSDEPVRTACIDALALIAHISGHAVWIMNDFFWPLGRSCCHLNPICISGKCEKEPCTFNQMVTLQDNHPNCIFRKFCFGSREEQYRNLYEPIIQTHYY